jgi:anti-anti-sigma factor
MNERAREMRNAPRDADMGLELPAAPRPFSTTLEPHRETIVVVAQGELDLLTAGQLAKQFDELLDRGFARVVLDLGEVDFIDSSGLRAILDMHAKSRGDGIDFALIHGSDQARRLFEVSGAAAELHFLDPSEIDGYRH